MFWWFGLQLQVYTDKINAYFAFFKDVLDEVATLSCLALHEIFVQLYHSLINCKLEVKTGGIFHLWLQQPADEGRLQMDELNIKPLPLAVNLRRFAAAPVSDSSTCLTPPRLRKTPETARCAEMLSTDRSASFCWINLNQRLHPAAFCLSQHIKVTPGRHPLSN